MCHSYIKGKNKDQIEIDNKKFCHYWINDLIKICDFYWVTRGKSSFRITSKRWYGLGGVNRLHCRWRFSVSFLGPWKKPKKYKITVSKDRLKTGLSLFSRSHK